MSIATSTPEKVVYIKRKVSFMESAQANDPEVVEYQSMAFKAIGSFYKEFGKQFGSGLTRKEVAVLMPEVTGYNPEVDKRDFAKASNEFFRNINTKIPGEGVRLNIALENPNEPLSEDNMPVNIRDYITYRHAVGHPEVGASFEEASMYEHIRFYIEDEEGVIAAATDLNTQEDEARMEYYQIIESYEKIDQMLTLLGISIVDMKLQEKKLMLKEYASLDPNRSAANNSERLETFVKLASDRDLEMKYRIEEMVRVGVLERVGMRILIKETGDLIGKDIRDAAMWFKDAGHSREVNVLTARYNEFNRGKKIELPLDIVEDSPKTDEGADKKPSKSKDDD